VRTTREHGNVCINGQRSPRTHTRDVIPLRFQSKRRHLLSSKACPVGPVLVDCHHSDDAARAAIAGHGQRDGILHKGLALLLGHALLVVGVAVAVNVRAAAAANGKRLLDQGAPDGNAEYLETKKRDKGKPGRTYKASTQCFQEKETATAKVSPSPQQPLKDSLYGGAQSCNGQAERKPSQPNETCNWPGRPIPSHKAHANPCTPDVPAHLWPNPSPRKSCPPSTVSCSSSTVPGTDGQPS